MFIVACTTVYLQTKHLKDKGKLLHFVTTIAYLKIVHSLVDEKTNLSKYSQNHENGFIYLLNSYQYY